MGAGKGGRTSAALALTAVAAVAAVALAVLAAVLARPAEAQTLRGRVADGFTGTPVEGALVDLVDAGGRRVRTVLSGSGGGYRIEAPGPGGWSLRVRGLGYRTTDFGPWELAEDQTRDEALVLEPSPVALRGIVAGSSRRCVLDPAEGTAAALLWDEARKVLEVTALVNREGRYRFEIVRYRRRLDTDRRRLLEERAETALVGEPFGSPPADSLVRLGFVWTEGSDLTFWMPDPEVALSRAFLDTHCLRVEDGDDPTRIGLAFEPVGSGGVSDVRGVLWLDREGGALRSLEYEYTDLPVREMSGHAGGWAEFERLEDGAFVVRRWAIRMPTVARPARGSRRSGRPEVVDLVEEGGELLEARRRYGGGLTRAATGRLEVTVVDSLTGGTPLVGAEVRLSSTPWRDTTDAAGRVVLEGLPRGRYLATFRHPRMDTVAMPWIARPVEVPGAGTVLLALPSRASLLAELCGDMDPDSSQGVVSGFVRSPGGDALEGTTVRLAFFQGGRERRRSIETRAGGFFRFCSVPTEGRVTLRVGEGSDPVEIRIPLEPRGFARRDVTLPSRPDSR